LDVVLLQDKSKHLETATMKVGTFWIDFVNLRAEEYTQDSRIPDLMRIGTAHEDAYRRDLTINSLFYNINTGQVEDWTGRGFQDLRKGVVSTPLHPLTTLLDDPLRVLRSIRFAARLRFTMDDELIKAAQMSSVADALSQKVSRERVGGELDLMLRSPDPVGAIRLLINLKQVQCVFPAAEYYKEVIVQQLKLKDIPHTQMDRAIAHAMGNTFRAGLLLLSAAHDHLADCLWSPPAWCINQKCVYDCTEVRLIDDEEGRRLLWYAAFLKPMHDEFRRITQSAGSSASTESTKTSRKSNTKHRSIVMKMLVDELKRPIRDSESIERIIKAADEFTDLMESGMDVSATMILLSDLSVTYVATEHNQEDNVVGGRLVCTMNGRPIDSNTEDDPVWVHAMEFRVSCAKVMLHIGSLWRASLFLAISEEIVKAEQQNNGGIEYAIEGDTLHEAQEERRQGVLERFDSFAAALQQIGLIGIWDEKPIADGDTIIKQILPGLPKGPKFRDVMDEQWNWMMKHPGSNIKALTSHLQIVFAPFVHQVNPENV
jgi:tRNA nucleotidyltransferase/poly(A) polymerase